MIRNLAKEYLVYGGFPEVIASPKDLHAPLIQGYMDAVVLRDIVRRHSIQNALIVQKFLFQILRQLAAPLSVTKIYRTLKSLGLALGKNSLFEYLKYFEEAYAVLTVPFFSLSERKKQVNPHKVYPIDPGIITAYSVKPDCERGALLETAVFMHLRRSYTHICYYKNQQQKEVDFVITTAQGELLLYQASVEMSDERTRKREISALFEICLEFGLSIGKIITEDHEEIMVQDGITLECIPYWRWALIPAHL